MSFIELAPSLSGARPIIHNLYLGQVAPINTIEVVSFFKFKIRLFSNFRTWYIHYKSEIIIQLQ